MQLRNKITVVRNVRIHHLSLLSRCKTQNAVVLNLEVADGMVKTTGKPIQLLLHGIRFACKHGAFGTQSYNESR